jgi:hypothetical protein
MIYTVLAKYSGIGLNMENKNFFVSKLIRNNSQIAKLDKRFII